MRRLALHTALDARCLCHRWDCVVMARVWQAAVGRSPGPSSAGDNLRVQ